MTTSPLQLAICAITPKGITLGQAIAQEISEARVTLFSTHAAEGVTVISSTPALMAEQFHAFDAHLFIGSLGICVRAIAPQLQTKATDPAVLCLDDAAQHVQAVIGGHAANANTLCQRIARITGAQAVISTSSDLQGLWPLDSLGKRFGWQTSTNVPMTEVMAAFNRRVRTGLKLEHKDAGTQYLTRTLPDFVEVFYEGEAVPEGVKLLLSVSPKKVTSSLPHLKWIPRTLHLGSGCAKDIPTEAFGTGMSQAIEATGYELSALASLSSIELKAQEAAYLAFAKQHSIPFITFSQEQLAAVTVPTPSEVVRQKIGVAGVAEASAMLMAQSNALHVTKQKHQLPSGYKFTLALAISPQHERRGHVQIIGAGPGDPELISVRGQRAISEADLILYAGSLVPETLTHGAKAGATVKNSASMTLEQQLALMHDHVRQGHSVVRLQSGDPSLYGAIQEQMHYFDKHHIPYEIVPGIGAYAAAAAVLKSEFTLPEKVQSIILTRGEGRTPMPEGEKLAEFAKHKTTLCIYLSARIASKVEQDLLAHYPPDTPTAVLYRISWPDELVVTCTLDQLAHTIKAHQLYRTTLIVVSPALGAREGRSHLYHPKHKHIFRNRGESETAALSGALETGES